VPYVSSPGAKVTDAQWYGLALLTLTFAVNQVDRNALIVVQEQLKHEFHLSDGQLGVLSGLAFGATYAVCAIPLGLLADRTNRRNLLAAIMALWSIATAFGAFARNFHGLLFSRMAIAAAESGTSPAANSLISDLFPPDRRATAVGIFFLGPAIGMVVSFLFGGHVAADYGWRAVFLIAGAPGLILSLLMLLTFREPRRGQMEHAVGMTGETRATFVETLGFVFRTPVVLLIILGLMLSSMASTSMLGWCVSMLIREHGFDVKSAGAVMALCVGVTGGVGVAGGGRLADFFSKGDSRRALVFAANVLLLSFAAVLFFVLAPSRPIVLAGLVVYGALHLAQLGPCFGVVLNATPLRMRGVVVAILQIAANFIGGGFGPLLVGLLSDAYGGTHSLKLALLTCSPEYLIAAVILLLAVRRLPRVAAA
jgi:predicted MFS family arabinose efflux permease